MHVDAIQDMIGSHDTAEDAMDRFWYHGTYELFTGDLSSTSYDGCLWLADNPAVAQVYIPDAPAKMLMTAKATNSNRHVRSWGRVS